MGEEYVRKRYVCPTAETMGPCSGCGGGSSSITIPLYVGMEGEEISKGVDFGGSTEALPSSALADINTCMVTVHCLPRSHRFQEVGAVYSLSIRCFL